MKDELFQQLAASLKEGGAILRGKKKPARSTTLQRMFRVYSTQVIEYQLIVLFFGRFVATKIFSIAENIACIVRLF